MFQLKNQMFSIYNMIILSIFLWFMWNFDSSDQIAFYLFPIPYILLSPKLTFLVPKVNIAKIKDNTLNTNFCHVDNISQIFIDRYRLFRALSLKNVSYLNFMVSCRMFLEWICFSSMKNYKERSILFFPIYK